MSELPTRLEYNAGLENAPGDPFGRTELAIEPDGSARLVHRRAGRVRAWRATIELATLQAAWAALERGGFPTIPRHQVPGGAALRTVIAHHGDQRQGGHVAWHAARELPGFAEAFAILDSIVRQMSEDTVKAAPNTLPPVIQDLREDPDV